MELQERIVEKLQAGKTFDQLSAELELSTRTLKAVVELLEHRGVLVQVDCDSTCNNCPMGSSCPVPDGGREKLYVVAEETE